MNRSPAEIRDRWMNYGRRYARYPTLWDSSLAFASGPLAPEAGTLQDYSGRTAGAAWSVGAGDSPKYVQGTVKGQAFWAGQYDGSNDYATNGLNTAADFGTDACSIVCWFNSVQYAKYVGLLNKIPASGRSGYVLKLEFGLVVLYNNVANRIGSTARYDDGNWHCAVFTRTGSALALWVDGFNVRTASVSLTLSASSEELRFGDPWSGGVPYYSGLQCGQRLYRRTIAPDEIATLADNPLAAFEVDVPRYWSFATSTHLWPWQIRRSRRVRGHR